MSKRKSLADKAQNRLIAGHSKRQRHEKEPTPNPDDEDLYDSDDEEGGLRIGDIYIPPPIKPYCSTKSKGPRLIITKIVNENFKSYAGRVTLGPFHHCFTAIIGPNGSGKSNVIDSMLFVFGYRAQKIRCKKLSVLLHNSAKFSNVSTCSVSIHFKQIVDVPNGEVEEVPNSEIIITRTAHKDNTSFYSLNRAREQIKEISKLLKQHGVDLDHNRFLILQGEVESIALMKPKGPSENECGMVEYLEDIIGTTRYKEPLLKLNARVETLNEERSEKHNRCKMAEQEMKDLEQPYNDAVDYLKLENTLSRSKNLLIQKTLSEQGKKLNGLNAEKENIDKELQEHNEKIEQNQRDKQAKEALIKEEIQQFQKLCKEKEAIEQKVKDALNNYTETQETMAETNKRRKKNIEQVKKLEAQLEEIKNIPKKNEAEIAECEKKMESLAKKKETLEAELQTNYQELEAQTKPLIEERDQLETELIDLKKNCDEAKAALSLAQSELEILKQDEVEESRKYETLKTSYEETKNDYVEKKQLLEEMQQSIPALKNSIVEKMRRLEENKKEEAVLYEKLMTLRAEISEKQSSLQATRSNNKVLDALMREKMAGRIVGILGRLGDLGAIESKFDVAISTACGRLDNIVTETVNTATECIEFLKRHDLGRCSFIALEKVEHLRRYFQQPMKFPENVPRLFDLVRVEDDRLRPAFYFALRDTLVSNEMVQARRIAFGQTRYRVVTLIGEVLEMSGTMSGGGTSRLKGKMGTQVATKTARKSTGSSDDSQKNLDQLQMQAEQMQSRINLLQQEQGQLERDIASLKSQVQMKESELNKVAITVKSWAEQLPRIQEHLKVQKKRKDETVADQHKVAQLEKDIQMKKKEFEISDKTVSEISKKISAAKKRIADIHGDKIKSVQQKIDATAKQIKTLNGNVLKLKVEITTSQRNYEKTEKQIEDLKAEIKTAEEMLLKLKDDRARYDQEGIELAKKVEEICEEIEKIEKSTQVVKKEIMAIQSKEGDLNLKKVEIEEKLETLLQEISEVRNQIPRWQNRVSPPL